MRDFNCTSFSLCSVSFAIKSVHGKVCHEKLSSRTPHSSGSGVGGVDREGVLSVATELAIRCGGLLACLGRGRHTGTEGESEQGEE